MVEPCAAGEIHCALCGGAQLDPYGTVFDVKRRGDKTRYSLYQCVDCAFVFLDPRQLSEEEDYYGEGYSSHSPKWHKKIDQWKRDAIPCDSPKRILDVGCGSGKWIYKRQIEGHEVFGLETNAHAVAVARSQGLNVISCLAELPDNFFDVIRMGHVLEHTPQPMEMMRGIYGKVHPQGYVEVGVPNLDSVKFTQTRAFSGLVDAPRHCCFFTADTLRNLLERAGYYVKRVDWISLPFPVTLYEFLGDTKRFAMYCKKARPGLGELLRSTYSLVTIRLNGNSRKGRASDWLLAKVYRDEATGNADVENLKFV